jgi:hypothetical protein
VNASSDSSEGESQVSKENPIPPGKAAAGLAGSCLSQRETAASNEKRRVERTRMDQLLYVELGTGNGGIVLDVSEEGCGFLSIAPIWDNEPHFSFAIGGGRQIQGEGKIVWVDESKKLGGLRFVNATPAFREQVRAWLAEPKVEMAEPAPQAKAGSHTDVLKPIESRPVKITPEPDMDSPAKERRRKLREEARAQMEAAERALRGLEPGERLSLTEKRTDDASGSANGARGEVFLHGPSDPAWPTFLASRKVWKGVAGFVLGAAVAGIGVAYRQEAGTGLMRLGKTLAGKEEQVTPAAQSKVVRDAAAPDQAAEHPKVPIEAGSESNGVSVNSPKSTESANVLERVIHELKVPSTNAPATSASRVADSSPIERKLNGTSEEPTDKPPQRTTETSAPSEQPGSQKQQARGTPHTPRTDAHPAENSAALKATAPAQGGESKKREPRHATAEQVQALWSEVEGGDVSAEVALGELYARGNGVPKSCGQARMLLTSATRKGSDEARQKLEQLAEQGCP